ncbi:Na/Pi cotransporter family protein [Enterocloster bolteae]|uniref:Na/Pi cotransporter family protein n=1 Tax=Enterocloster bolteae TaxID=208479 RepID=UPI003AF0DC5D
MSIHSFFSLLGGLALFLYGMQMMSTNLEAAAGSRMKQILERLTANRFLGVFVGAGITAIIQSSSATTVMVVGFVNSQLMTLKQAVWIIMGANIGTTVTGQLIALDIGAIAPLIAFAGVALILFVKQKKVQFAGGIIAGLGILFLGMGMMSAAMIPLRDSQHFVNLMTKFSNPFLGILAGAAFTAIIQSSSASVGILQALAVSGLIGLDSAVFVLFGQNIGTCITAVLASIGANRDAKRTTLIHLIFNVIGTTVFTLICLVSPFTQWMASFTPDNPAAQIANVHTLFNIITTLLLLPFGTQLARISEKLLPDKPQKTTDEERWFEDLLASEHVLGVSVIARKQLNEDISRMLALAASNVETSFLAFEHRDEYELEQIQKREEEIDLYNAQLSRRISRVLAVENSPSEVNALNRMFSIIGNVERIGDHATNIAGYARTMMERRLELSSQASVELADMRTSCMRAVNLICSACCVDFTFAPEQESPDKRGSLTEHDAPAEHISLPQHASLLEQALLLEQDIDSRTARYRSNQIERMRKGKCHVETSILYSEILTDYERIGDHAFNIAQALDKLDEN